VRIQVSPEAAAFIGANGGQLWVWAARPRMCCSGSPAWMHAATAEPDGVHGFTSAEVRGLRLHFRPVAGQQPDVLEVDMTGGRHPKVAAYWDGCLMAMA
jgi:hypothetical protein